MNQDPICGMEVDEEDAPTTMYKETEYAFCSEDCKNIFEANPEKYVLSPEGENVGRSI